MLAGRRRLATDAFLGSSGTRPPVGQQCEDVGYAVDAVEPRIDRMMATARVGKKTPPASERQGRAIDRDKGASMEEKKRRGYF